jgi:hypothetical protein
MPLTQPKQAEAGRHVVGCSCRGGSSFLTCNYHYILTCSFVVAEHTVQLSRHINMPFNTALTRKLGIKVPIVQGGMMWVGYAELASAVSNAGALGILTALTQPTPEDLRK